VQGERENRQGKGFKVPRFQGFQGKRLKLQAGDFVNEELRI
jgi:hypothetical protein